MQSNQQSSKSIRQQLFKRLLLLILPIIIISGVVSYYVAHQYINAAYDKSLYRSALALADQITLEELGAPINLSVFIRNFLEYDEEDDVYFRVVGPSGDLISTHTELPLPKTYPKDDEVLFYNTSLNNSKVRAVIYALPIDLIDLKQHTENKQIYVMIGETFSKRTDMTDEVMVSILLPQLIIALLVSWLIFFGIKHGLSPLEQLKNELQNRDANDLTNIEISKIPSELNSFVNAFNGLLTKLKHSSERQKRFTADAAHQLKTPLAGLKMQAELAMREKNIKKSNHALEQINIASENLTHVVNQLLNLSKAEPENIESISLIELDLVELAKEVSANWVAKAIKKEIDFGFDSTLDNAFILGNKTLLIEMMNNLIDNAIKYSLPKGRITVGIKEEHNFIVLYVQDSGVGISIEDQAKVFERFYRVLGNQQQGSGLGLSIVKEIADRHQATVSLISGEGSLFIVSFPKH